MPLKRGFSPLLTWPITDSLSNKKFRLESSFREIDSCSDIEALRKLTKQIIIAQENEKAFVREAVQHIRYEMEAEVARRNRTSRYQSEPDV